jgi:hypothetical protein
MRLCQVLLMLLYLSSHIVLDSALGSGAISSTPILKVETSSSRSNVDSSNYDQGQHQYSSFRVFRLVGIPGRTSEHENHSEGPTSRYTLVLVAHFMLTFSGLQ